MRRRGLGPVAGADQQSQVIFGGREQFELAGADDFRPAGLPRQGGEGLQSVRDVKR
jgi:hypothetical protein